MNAIHLKSELNNALSYHRSGAFQDAERIYNLLISTNQNADQAHFLLGLLASQTQRPALARHHLGLYLESNPDNFQAVEILALSQFELGNFIESISLFKKRIRSGQPTASLYYNLGQAYFKLENHADAIDAYKMALLLEPSYVKANISLGIAQKELKLFNESKLALNKAIDLEPNNAEAYFFLGNVLRETGEFLDSIQAYKAALKIRENYLEAAVNCANSYKDLGQHKEAVHFYNAALLLEPHQPEAQYNKSLALLSDAQFQEGWQLYEWRFKSTEAQQKFIQQSLLDEVAIWDGRAMDGSLLVLPEQGIGDQIFFAGLLPELIKLVKNVTVCVNIRLLPLLNRSFPDITFVNDLHNLASYKFNAQIHIGSLAQFLRTRSEAFANTKSPYLLADQEQTRRLRNDMKCSDSFICGISWLSKNADHGNAKSLSLAALKDALTLPGFDFVDLQYGDTQHEREQFHADHGVRVIKRDEIDNFKDIDGLASLIDACDLVITVSNTTAHLACALGKPTLVLLPQSSAVFWYWHRKGMQSPWYPTAVMLRQEELGGWPQVVGTVRHILQGMQ